MKPDEWQRAMDHEAASVEDQGWARETQWMARRGKYRREWLWIILWTLSLFGLMAGLRALVPSTSVPYVGLIAIVLYMFSGAFVLAKYGVSLTGTLLGVLLLAVAILAFEQTSLGTWIVVLLPSFMGWHLGRRSPRKVQA